VVDPTEYTVTRNGLELDETMAEITGEMWQGASALVRQSAQLQRQQNLTASAVAMVIRLNGRCGREKRRGRLRWRCRNRASDGDPLGHCSSCRSTTGASKAFPLRNFRRSRAAQQLETRRLYSEHYRKRSTVLIAQKPANVAKPLASPRSVFPILSSIITDVYTGLVESVARQSSKPRRPPRRPLQRASPVAGLPALPPTRTWISMTWISLALTSAMGRTLRWPRLRTTRTMMRSWRTSELLRCEVLLVLQQSFCSNPFLHILTLT